MGLILDSSVLIAAERGKLDLDAFLAAHADEPVALAAVTASELLHGIHRAEKPAQKARREAFVERLLAGVPVIAFDLVVARTHARLWADLLPRGIVIGAHDLMIAATALAVGYDVATRDKRSFPKITAVNVILV